MQMKFNILSVLILASGLNRLGVTGRIMNPPQNTVAEVGGQAIFNCTSDLTVPSWIFSKTREEVVGSTGQSIVANCAVLPGFATHYDVDRPGGNNNQCNLIVKATTMHHAGVYTCSDTQTGPSAMLTTIDRDASITVSNQTETVEEDIVTMSYTVRYNSSTASSQTPTIQPVLTWTDSDGNNVTSTPSSTANSVTSSISVTAGRQDIRPYTCHISYTSPSTKPSFASNTPNSVSNPPTTSNINVLYAPNISAPISVCWGKTVNITCHATANPAPTYSWIGPGSRNYSGATIIVDYYHYFHEVVSILNGTYTCNASNVIRGSTRSDTKETILNVSSEREESCMDASDTVVQGKLLTAAAIVLGFITVRCITGN